MELNPLIKMKPYTDDEEGLETRVARIQRIQVRVAELGGGLVGSEEVYTKRFKATFRRHRGQERAIADYNGR